MAKFSLGVTFAQGSGKLGNIVINKGKNGQVTVRSKVTPTNPRTAAQLAVRAAQTKSAQTFRNMTTAQVGAWNNYAATLPQVSKKSGRKTKITGIMAFCGLTDKFLQITPGGTVPMTPPASAFTGDVITVTATGGTGSITFTGTAANAANVKTELLIQVLKGKNRLVTAKGYRTKAFIAYASGTLSSVQTVAAGYYGVAYRFVNTTTGQETAIIPIGVVTVS